MRHTLLLTALSLLCFTTLSAQIVTTEEVEDKVENKVDQRVDQKIDQGIDKSLDKLENALFGKKKKKKKDKSEDAQEEQSEQEEESTSADENAAAYSMFSGGDAQIQDSYSFDTETNVKITTTEKNGKKQNEMIYNMLFPDEAQYFAMEMTDMNGEGAPTASFIIFDYNTEQMVNLIESSGQKMAMVMKMNQDQIQKKIEEHADEEGNYSFEKTGRTKDILGYTCEEYAMKSDDGHGTFWITKATNLRIGMAMGSMVASNPKSKMQMPADMPTGAILEMNYENTDGSSMKWETMDIKTNISKTISTKDYKQFNMGGMDGR